MDLLQTVDIKTADIGQKNKLNQVRESISNEAMKTQDKLFKDQLSEQTSQLNSPINQKKTKTNQEDSGSKADDIKSPVETSELKTEIPKETNVSDADDNISSIIAGTDGATAAIIMDPNIAALLAEEGNNLPVPDELVGGITMASEGLGAPLSLSEEMVKIVSSSPKAELNATQINPSTQAAQGLNDSINKLMPNKLLVPGIQTLAADASPQKPLNIMPSLSANLSEKALLQDAKLTKMSSEFSATEVISQASRLQQVPITTAVSASLSATQNPSTGMINETANALTQTVNLNNTSSINAPLNNALLSTAISANVGSPNWSQQMTQQVAYMVKGGIQQAEIKLNPANLGPMEIKLSISDDKASVNFVTQHASVRDALDSALPRLKEMLEQQGLNLADANVSTQSEQRQANSEMHDEKNTQTSDALSDSEQENHIEENVLTEIVSDAGVSIFA